MSSLYCFKSQNFEENLNPDTFDLCNEQFVQTNFEHLSFSQFDHNDLGNNKN